MSASLSASTSLTPSPVIATVCPRDCSACTMARFWSGRTRPNVVYSSRVSASLSGLVGQLAGVHRLALQPERAGHGAHRHRVVAGDHLDRNLLRGKVIQRVAGVRADALLEHHQRHRCDAAGGVGVVDGQVTRAEQQHPQAQRPDPLGFLGDRGHRARAARRAPRSPSCRARRRTRHSIWWPT